MNSKALIKITEEYVKDKMSGFDGGHDWWHIHRVRNMALLINDREALADPFTLEITALLHDMADSKFKGKDAEKEYLSISNFMDDAGMTEIKGQVIEVIRNVSFSNKNPSGNMNDPVLLVLQDADRLDAIGAIGIARAFNYGGFRNNPLYNPSEDESGEQGSTIAHFYDKLLKLKDLMNTATARMIADERHAILEEYLTQFYKEWNFSG
jgi:uncharacterized protein